jgi:glyoxalase family protein
VSAALDYHRATNVPAGGTDEDEARRLETRPHPFKEYGGADRVPLSVTVAGPLLGDGAGVLRTRSFPGVEIHFRGYSSAGALYPVEAYVVAPEALYSFDALGPALVTLRSGDARPALAEAAAAPELAASAAVIVLTGIHARTGWKYMERGYRHIWWDAGTMLANLLALAAADELGPRLYTGFVDRAVNDVLGVDGLHEFAVALLALGEGVESLAPSDASAEAELDPERGRRYALAERLQESSALADAAAVRAWRSGAGGDEPKRDRDALVRAIRRRGSVREYSSEPLPRDALADILDWSEAPIPADADPVVRQLVTVAAVDGLEPGVYDGRLEQIRTVGETELRERVGHAAMDQDHPRLAAATVFQLADVEAVVERLGDRGYRCAQLEAGIRAGRLQIGAFMERWGAAASTFFDDEVSRLLETDESPLLMVALGQALTLRNGGRYLSVQTNMRLEGIHHVTAITGDAPQNVRFYADTLGLRMVKKTVNQDDPTVYHLFYADEEGSPGADITFFEYPGARQGRAGAGMVHRVVFRVGSEEALDFWEQRVGGRRGDGSLVFSDPEGLGLELVVDDSGEPPLVARHPEIPEEHAIRGFAGVRAFSADPQRSEAFLREGLGFEAASPPAEWVARGEERSGFYVYDEPPAERGVPGAGTVHHVAFASTMEDHTAWQQRVADWGLRPTPVIDRFWFRSVYFREPSGVLFEIATLGPGFTADEPLETLGEALVLPPAFEHLRPQIEQTLTPLPSPRERVPS